MGDDPAEATAHTIYAACLYMRMVFKDSKIDQTIRDNATLGYLIESQRFLEMTGQTIDEHMDEQLLLAEALGLYDPPKGG